MTPFTYLHRTNPIHNTRRQRLSLQQTAAEKLIIFGDDELMLENKYNNNLNNFINIALLNKHNPIH
jgi:hypothetical protein